jgi:hypothetical protein
MSTEFLQVINKLDAVLQKQISERHSYFQVQNFIIGTEHTIQGKLWQILRELRGKKENVQFLLNDLETNEENRELMEIKIEKEEYKKSKLVKSTSHLDMLNLKEIELNIKKYTRKHKNLAIAATQIKEKMTYIEEEINFLLHAFEKLSEVEEVKPIDDLDAQKEYWNAKLTQEINLSILLGKPLAIDVIKLALSLHDEAPVKKQVLNILKSQMEKIAPEAKELIKVKND